MKSTKLQFLNIWTHLNSPKSDKFTFSRNGSATGNWKEEKQTQINIQQVDLKISWEMINFLVFDLNAPKQPKKQMKFNFFSKSNKNIHKSFAKCFLICGFVFARRAWNKKIGKTPAMASKSWLQKELYEEQKQEISDKFLFIFSLEAIKVLGVARLRSFEFVYLILNWCTTRPSSPPKRISKTIVPAIAGWWCLRKLTINYRWKCRWLCSLLWVTLNQSQIWWMIEWLWSFSIVDENRWILMLKRIYDGNFKWQWFSIAFRISRWIYWYSRWRWRRIEQRKTPKHIQGFFLTVRFKTNLFQLKKVLARFEMKVLKHQKSLNVLNCVVDFQLKKVVSFYKKGGTILKLG